MELIQVGERTYYIKNPTNIGIYKIDDILRLEKPLLNKFIIYKNKDNLYLKPKEKISNIELGIILENSEIIYGAQADKIKKKSQIIK